MNDKELWKLISIISEGQDSEQRRKVEQYITDLQKEIERLNNIINELEKELNKDYTTFLQKDTTMRETGKTYKAGANNYRMHIYLKLQELKGSDSNEKN